MWQNDLDVFKNKVTSQTRMSHHWSSSLKMIGSPKSLYDISALRGGIRTFVAFSTIFKLWQGASMSRFVGWSVGRLVGRSVCLQKISKTLKRRFCEYKLMK